MSFKYQEGSTDSNIYADDRTSRYYSSKTDELTEKYSKTNDLFSRREPLNIIDSVLREDSKVTTYKFALLPALAEIASYSYNSAKWFPDYQSIKAYGN